ncbi:predicted protein [Chaetoceros tenuissimus]|uniref:Uncharacterized protein n=1 Tax=Chaetoceros tenuissimus TaxID=426638 RepID=A0AAD3CWP4_9STRA|nr:predicted protein [Chaetoceros tenuissimus]
MEDFELSNYVHDLDQHSSDHTSTIMTKNAKDDDSSYESNRGKQCLHSIHQDDNSHFSYLDDFDLLVEETDHSQTEVQMQNDYIYKHEKEEGGVAVQSRKLHQDIKMDSSSASFMVDTGIAKSYEYPWTREKRKKNTSKTRTHLSSTLNFPYKPQFQRIESNTSSNAHQSGIWKDEGDNAEVLEKHFNSTWQFKFMKSFYCTNSSRATMRSNEERVEEGNNCCDEDMKRRGKERNDLKGSKSLATNRPSLISLVEKERVSIDDALMITKEKLLDAMDSTDISRDQVLRIEDEIGIDRATFWKGKFQT